MKRKKPLMVFILGPTSAGKSDIAVRVSKRIAGEIISCDSMQVYKGMPIISQQPPPKLRREVRHSLIGILDPSKEWSAADFVAEAHRVARDIVKRDKIPVVSGGTGLYARSFINGLFPSPPKDDKLRRALYQEARKKGKEKLYKRLCAVDPVYAGKIHRNDLRRIVRALEVHKLTGKPISEGHKESRGIRGEYDVLVFILNRDRKELYERINGRVEKMFGDGLISEVKKLKKKKLSATAESVLGYREIDDHLSGRRGLEEAKALLKKRTRQYAKRQLVWFRKEEGARWVELTGKKSERVAVDLIVKAVNI